MNTATSMSTLPRVSSRPFPVRTILLASNQIKSLNGQRVKVTTGSTSTDFLFPGWEITRNGSTITDTRYYDPASGQFMSPDTLVPDPDNLFAYNRYMYGYGNPLRYTDPSGHDPCSTSGDWGSCVPSPL